MRQSNLLIGRPSDKLSGTRTGNSTGWLRRHLQVVGLSESAKCRKCRREESFYRILCQCPAFAGHRLEICCAWQGPIDIRRDSCRFMSRGSSGSVVSDYGLDDREIEVRSPTGAEDFSSSLCVQTGSGAHPTSYPMGAGGPFPGGKARPGRDANHSPPSSAEVKYE
jgi:hypothetical protein